MFGNHAMTCRIGMRIEPGDPQGRELGLRVHLVQIDHGQPRCLDCRRVLDFSRYIVKYIRGGQHQRADAMFGTRRDVAAGSPWRCDSTIAVGKCVPALSKVCFLGART